MAFVLIEVAWRSGKGEVVVVLGYNLLYLVEDEVGIFLRTFYREADLRREGFAHLGLRQVGHHDGSIEPAFGHLVQVDEDAVVAVGKVDVLREEHWRVAVGVKGEHMVVDLLCMAIL